MTATEIIRGVFVGDYADAAAWKEEKISVIGETAAGRAWPTLDGEERHMILIEETYQGSEPTADVSELTAVAERISKVQRAGGRILIHCGAGIERSPLAVVWFLMTKCGMTCNEAYALVMSRRPIVQDRRVWLPVEWR